MSLELKFFCFFFQYGCEERKGCLFHLDDDACPCTGVRYVDMIIWQGTSFGETNFKSKTEFNCCKNGNNMTSELNLASFSMFSFSLFPQIPKFTLTFLCHYLFVLKYYNIVDEL